MGKAYFITGTGTDIGKTLVTSILYKVLSRLGIKRQFANRFKPATKMKSEVIQIFTGLKQGSE